MNPDLLAPGQDPQLPMAVPALAALTRPLPMGKCVAKHYICLVPNASMHRTDGKRLGFVLGYLRTDFVEDIKFLDAEIGAGNQYIREATPEEVRAAQMRLDPRGTMTQEIEAALRPQLEVEIRAKLEAQIRAEFSRESKMADGAKLAGTDTAAQRARNIASKLTVPGATVVLTSQAAPIRPQSTADIADAAQSSGK